MHDGPSNIEILQAWASSLGVPWPEGLVDRSYKDNKAEARKALVSELRKDIPGLKVISLEDRDDCPFAETKSDLTCGSMQPFKGGLGLRRWCRRNIENYLLHPAAIARASGKTEEEVRQFLKTVHGLSITSQSRWCTDAPENFPHAFPKRSLCGPKGAARFDE